MLLNKLSFRRSLSPFFSSHGCRVFVQSSLLICPAIPFPASCKLTPYTPTQTYLVCLSFTYRVSTPNPASCCSAMLERRTSQPTVLLCQLVWAYILPIGGNGEDTKAEKGEGKPFPCLCAVPAIALHLATAAGCSLSFSSALPELASLVPLKCTSRQAGPCSL